MNTQEKLYKHFYPKLTAMFCMTDHGFLSNYIISNLLRQFSKNISVPRNRSMQVFIKVSCN